MSLTSSPKIRSSCQAATFSRAWSMAAARLGYLVGPAWIVDQLSKVALYI